MNFADLGLREQIVQAVTSEGYTTPTPIQEAAIPSVLAGRDVLGSAQTGTGKTAAFALPILQRLTEQATQSAKPKIRCLVLCPTRELATQIADSFRAYGQGLKLRHTVIFGGVNPAGQVDALRRGIDIVVATPGRLLDLLSQGHVDLRNCETVVLDEADRMLDMGFINDIRKIVSRLPKQRQTLFFSATMPPEIRRLADAMLHDPVTVHVTPVATPAEGIDQCVYFVERINKPALLAHLVEHIPMARAIVFARTKHGADRVVRQLHLRGIRADSIHGNKSQNARQRALANFKASKTPVLVATDIASRGLDIDDITHVVNYDLTHEPETYVHRIGRTARAGASGAAISFCDREERSNLRAIEQLLKMQIPIKTDHPDYAQASAKLAATGTDDRRSHSGGAFGHSRPPEREMRESHPRESHSRGGPRHEGHARSAPPRGGQHRSGLVRESNGHQRREQSNDRPQHTGRSQHAPHQRHSSAPAHTAAPSHSAHPKRGQSHASPAARAHTPA
ncbi:MAG: DEAD/DEAH box helicase, partial [Planctomycetota bacterium]|nr:DEAD/DEAH box helicase [Planctomycetota bacterium]